MQIYINFDNLTILKTYLNTSQYLCLITHLTSFKVEVVYTRVLFLISYKIRHAAICIEYNDRWKALLQNSMESVVTEYEGRKYVYCETTSDHFRIGGISPDFTVKDFEIKIELKG